MTTIELDKLAVEDLVDLYCASWSEPDPARRREMTERAWVENGTYLDPQANTRGREELVAHIGQVLAKYPGSRVVRTSKVDRHHNVLRFAWHMVLADGRTLPDGIDFAELSSDGRLVRITGFFGRLGSRQPAA